VHAPGVPYENATSRIKIFPPSFNIDVMVNLKTFSPLLGIIHAVSLPVSIILYAESIRIYLNGGARIMITNYLLIDLASIILMIYFITQVGILYFTYDIINKIDLVQEKNTSIMTVISLLFFGMVIQIPFINQIIISYYLNRAFNKVKRNPIDSLVGLGIANIVLNGLTSGFMARKVYSFIEELQFQQHQDPGQGSFPPF
jgi:hypothetical protein